MSNRLMHEGWRIAVAGALIALAAAPTRAAVEQGVTMRAAAAAGGIAKAERWASIVVTLDSSQGAFNGELLVSWGEARLRRFVALPSPGKRQFDLYVRTTNPEATIRVRLLSRDVELQALDVPVRVLDQRDPVTLCVASDGGLIPDTSCTATTAPDLLPRSARGYEAVDRVVWPAGERRLSAEQRVAFERWQSFRQLEASGDLGFTPQPTRPVVRRGIPGPAARVIAGVAASYVACLTLAGLVAGRRRMSLARMSTTVALVVMAGSGAASGIGHIGPAQAIHVRQASLLQQIPGVTGSMLTMRGIVEFPAFDTFVLHFPLGDGSVDLASARGRPERVVDENGLPVISGPYGLGARQAFAAEAVVDVQPLAVMATGRTLTVSNRSDFDLRDCRFAEGFSVTEVGVVAPGASATAEELTSVLGPVFTCTVDGPVIDLMARRRQVETQGPTVVAVYRSRLR